MNIKMYLFLFSMLLLSSCKPKEAEQLELLMDELGITFTCPSDSNVVVVIPTNGCASCIQGALNDTRESCDTAFVFLGSSKKEFSLLYKGKTIPSYPNVYLAKNLMSYTPDMMLTYPIAYTLKQGRYAAMTPYVPLKRTTISDKPKTEVHIDKSKIDLGDINMNKVYKDSVKITNRGNADLYISEIESSCECTQVEYEKLALAPSESTYLYITFHPEGKGYFERYVSIHCNIANSPIEILINGRIK